MNAKEIITRRFEKAKFGGYSTDDVDEFLKEVSAEYAQLQKEKSELERKLDVLADKIREYRDDEEALKDALLLAQKQGNQIISESKSSAEKLKKETDEAVAKQLAETKEKCEKMTKSADDYAKRTVNDANERAEKMVREARAKAEEIKTMMEQQQEIQEQILQQTRREVMEYRTRLLAGYKAHLEYIDQLPEKVENEYVKKTAEEVEKREAEKAKAEAEKKAKTAKQDAAKKAEEEKKAKKPEDTEEKPAPVEDEPFKPVSEETDGEGDSEGQTAELPFFKAGSESKQRRTGLQFGKNS